MIADPELRRRLPREALAEEAERSLRLPVEKEYALAADPARFLPRLATLGPALAVDIGASWGCYAWFLAQRFARVLAVEPNPELAGWLRAALPPACAVVEAALGDREGRAVLQVPRTDGAEIHGYATLAGHGFGCVAADGFALAGVDRYEVRETTLDALLAAEALPVGFVKLDAEGYERAVFRGAEATLRRDGPPLLVEIEQRHDPRFAELFAFLAGLGYAPFELLHGRLVPSGPEVVEAMAAVNPATLPPGAYRNNFLFLAPADLPRVAQVPRRPFRRIR